MRVYLLELFFAGFAYAIKILRGIVSFLAKFVEAVRTNRPVRPRDKAKNKPKFPINYRRSKSICFKIVK